MMRLGRLFLFYVIAPINLAAVVAYLIAGEWLHAGLVLLWSALIFVNWQEYTGWRKRTSAYMVAEKADRDRFAIDALKLKAAAANSIARRYRALGGLDPEVMDAIRQLFVEVAETWIPADAPAELHELKREARRVARAGAPFTIH